MFQNRELPFVLTNGAVSFDGKLALENRSLIQFSSAEDRRFVFQLRAQADAVLCGAETVDTFSIDLGAGPEECKRKRRRSRLPAEPLRILASRDGKISADARIFKKPVSPVIVLTTTGAAKQCAQKLRGLATVKGFGRAKIDFVRAFRWLHEEWKVSRLLCEGGGETNAALIRAGVIDEMHLTVCPLVLCGRDAPTVCDGDGFTSLNQATRLKLKGVKQLRGELFLTYQVLRKRN
jgi:5-amino-6-(5-phosphoribosylamino)uracil reductase